MQAVLDVLLKHYDVLRLRFHRVEKGWRQWYAEEQTAEEHIPLLVVDLAAVSTSDWEAELARVAGQVQVSLDLEQGPLSRLICFKSGEQKADRLLIVSHHLILDSVSWRIILEDLAQGYEQVVRGEPIMLAEKTSLYQQWAQALQQYAYSEQAEQQSGYWQAQETREEEA